MIFGIGFCSMNNLVGFSFKKTERAFKIATIYMVLLGFLPYATFIVESLTIDKKQLYDNYP